MLLLARLLVPLTLSLFMMAQAVPADPQRPLRIAELQPCRLAQDVNAQEFCMVVRGLRSADFTVHLGSQLLSSDQIERDDDMLRVRLGADDFSSRPLWLEQADQSSNPVWLSLQGAYVVAASEAETVRNRHDQNTYLDLVSLVIRDEFDGLELAQRLAAAYDAEIVGASRP